MNRLKIVVLLIFMIAFFITYNVLTEEKSAIEEAKAPFPNDFGEEKIDVSSYPAEHQKTYKDLISKCAKCHTIARPINSEFIELSNVETEKLNKESADLLKDPKILKSDETIWKRYVKRMMSKPGCEISSSDGKAIWQFLVFDSKKRKLGENWPRWKSAREKLLGNFKVKYPERYKEIFE